MDKGKGHNLSKSTLRVTTPKRKSKANTVTKGPLGNGLF
jgi:hypothetical protein